MLISFPNPLISKAIMVAAMEEHARQDELIAGNYGRRKGRKFRGCSVGCSIDTINEITGKRHSFSNHVALAKELGLPEPLIEMQDAIFEGLAQDQQMEWPLKFYRAIPENVDLTISVNRILVRVLAEIVLPTVAVDNLILKSAIEGACIAIETGDGLDIARENAWSVYSKALADGVGSIHGSEAARTAFFVSDAARAAVSAINTIDDAGTMSFDDEVLNAVDSINYAVDATKHIKVSSETYDRIGNIVIAEIERFSLTN